MRECSEATLSRSPFIELDEARPDLLLNDLHRTVVALLPTRNRVTIYWLHFRKMMRNEKGCRLMGSIHVDQSHAVAVRRGMQWILLLALSPVLAMAQFETATLTGTVPDSAQAAVAKATVR